EAQEEAPPRGRHEPGRGALGPERGGQRSFEQSIGIDHLPGSIGSTAASPWESRYSLIGLMSLCRAHASRAVASTGFHRRSPELRCGAAYPTTIVASTAAATTISRARGRRSPGAP